VNRRVLAVVAAVVLAALGGTLLFKYVAQADARAMAELAPVDVLVASAPIEAGTKAESLAGSVTTKSMPKNSVSPGALTSLDSVSGLVTASNLVPGEQLVDHRFISAEVATASTAVEIPAGLHQVTIQLQPVRVLGGHLEAGDTVGVFASLPAPSSADGETPEAASDGPNRTHIIISKALAVRVQGAPTPTPADPTTAEAQEAAATDEPTAELIPTADLMVTLALPAADAEKLVFAAEFERIWLSIEGDEATTEGTRAVTRENVFQ